MTPRGELSSAAIRALRPAKAAVDPGRPLETSWERERWRDGRTVDSLTVFLAGAECPFTCVFCDLWRSTLERPTPPGAIPRQLRLALRGIDHPPPQIKLYNASNFFDERAVPEADEPALGDLLSPFRRVVVESHPRLVGGRCFAFAERLDCRLQVAMGLETVHPEALEGLNKGMTLADFDRAAAACRDRGIGTRAFVLIGAPFVPHREAALWVERSAAHAFAAGVEHVVLIPVRGGNGAMERLAASGVFVPPTLELVEEVFERCRELRAGVVTVDLWDLEALAAQAVDGEARRAALAALNLGGGPLAPGGVR